jgi:hypothetical protein
LTTPIGFSSFKNKFFVHKLPCKNARATLRKHHTNFIGTTSSAVTLNRWIRFGVIVVEPPGKS